MEHPIQVVSVKIEPIDLDLDERGRNKDYNKDYLSYEEFLRNNAFDDPFQELNNEPMSLDQHKKDTEIQENIESPNPIQQTKPSIRIEDEKFQNNHVNSQEILSNWDEEMNVNSKTSPQETSTETPGCAYKGNENVKINRIGCPSCEKIFQNRINMKLHLKEVHSEDYFVECDQCYRTFKSHSNLKYHVECEHEKEGNGISCDICGKSFLNKKKLSNHKFYTHAKPEESVTCEVCHKTFKKKYKLKVHVRSVHSVERSAGCTQCNRVFKNEALLQRHVKWNHPPEGTVYKCDECGQEFYSLSCYKKHIENVHSESKEMTCEMCHRVLASKKSLTRHMKSVHKDGKMYWKKMKIGNIPCNVCDRKFTTNTALYWHMEQVHSDYYTPTKVCHICSKEFTEYYVLRRHLEMVHPIECATCQICNKTFKSEANLESHMRITHAPPEAAKTCEVCQKSFKCAMHLRIHMNAVHPKDGEVVCDICNRPFASIRYLNAHKKIHVQVRAFECNLCGNNFKRKVDVGKHIRKVHKKHECSVCNVMFGSSLMLNEHFEKEHRTGNVVSRCLKCAKCFTNDQELHKHITTCTSDGKQAALLSIVKIEVEEPSDED